MIPILYEKTETSFTSGGLGRLSDCLSCMVTEERNGVYECEFDYPITGAHYEDIQEGRIIAVTHDEQGDIQPFDIYSHSKPIDGVVTFYAHHISYRLGEITVQPFTASSCAGAVSLISSKSINTNPFTFWTNKSVTGDYNVNVPTSCRALLCGAEGSLLDVYGAGEYQFDKFNVKLYLHRGTNSGVEIRYGKNLVDLTDEVDYQETYNAVVPYWFGTTNEDDTEEDVLVTLPEWAISSGHDSYTGRIVLVPMDLSGEWQEPPDVNALRAKAQTLIASQEGWVPSQNIKVDFVTLWQTEEYEKYTPLQRVRLCDTVSVFYPELGIEAVEKKVVRVVYNVLLDRYDSIELGELSNTLVGMINANAQKELNDMIAQVANHNVTFEQIMEAAIQNATDLITGGLGGHVVMKQNADGQPEEILIMNTDDINTATKVWRWNLGGLGYSNTGYTGQYGTAITMDGSIVADFITAGTMNANILRAGIIADRVGANFWNLETGEFSLQASNTTWRQTANPAASWSTDDAKAQHVGNLWFYTGTGRTYLDFGLLDENGNAITNESSVAIDGTITIEPERVYRWSEDYGWTIFDGLDDAITSYDDTLTQTKVFNRLTNNGAVQGLYLQNGKVYLNASYIRSGILEVKKGTKTTFYADVNTGTVNIIADSFSLSSGETIQSIAEDAADSAEDAAKDYADATASLAASSAVTNYDAALNQLKVFNKLTNNGQTQGIYLSNNKLYINASYINTGALNASLITTGTINANLIKAGTLSDTGGNTSFNLSTGALTMTKGSISLGGAFSVSSAGALTCSNATITGGSLTIGSNFSVSSSGVIKAASGKIGPWSISGSGLEVSSDDYNSYVNRNNIRIGTNNDGFSYFWAGAGSSGMTTGNAAGRFLINMENSYLHLGRISNTTGEYYEGVALDSNSTTIQAPRSSAPGWITADTNGLTIVTGRQNTHSGNLYISGSGTAYFGVEGSSRKIKKDVAPIEKDELDPKRLYDVEVIQFKYKDEILDETDPLYNVDQPGFIVEDLEKIYPVVIEKDPEDPEESKNWSWSMRRIIPSMLKLIQDQHKDIEELKRRLS